MDAPAVGDGRPRRAVSATPTDRCDREQRRRSLSGDAHHRHRPTRGSPMGAFAAIGAWPGVLGELTAGRDLDADVSRGPRWSGCSPVTPPTRRSRRSSSGCASRARRRDEVVGLVAAMLAVAAPLELDDPDVDGRHRRHRRLDRPVRQGVQRLDDGVDRRRRRRRDGVQARQPQGLVDLRVDRPARGARCRGRARRPRRRRVRRARRVSGSPSPACSTRRCATSRRCGAELGIPTVFNVLGPLSHPGRVGRQVLGVSDPRLDGPGARGAAAAGPDPCVDRPRRGRPRRADHHRRDPCGRAA